MWDEEINKKIKDAADQYHPAYDDTAWEGMEKLLDEHLPRKKDRRAIIYFLPVILLVAGLLLFLNYPKKTGLIVPVSKIVEKPLLQNKHKPLVEPLKSSDEDIPGNNILVPGKKAGIKAYRKNILFKENRLNSGIKSDNRFSVPHTGKTVTTLTLPVSKNPIRNYLAKEKDQNPLSNKPIAKGKEIINNTISETTKPPGEEIVPPSIAGNNNALRKPDSTGIIKDKEESIKANEVAKAESSESKSTTGKQKKSFVKNFEINLGAGPDVSAVRLSNTGKITLTYGAGLSYSFTNRLTLRSGFYVARKIYTVNDEEYHVPPGSTWNNYLQSVDANCKVYEIPLTLSYHFDQIKNHSWFVSAGLSSYFMKRESYVYYYKNSTGVTWSKPWTVINKNKHYFSVVDISGGYKFSFNKRFSIIAEPYVKVPLSGIGIGKIRLNSAGMLFSVAVKPF